MHGLRARGHVPNVTGDGPLEGAAKGQGGYNILHGIRKAPTVIAMNRTENEALHPWSRTYPIFFYEHMMTLHAE